MRPLILSFLSLFLFGSVINGQDWQWGKAIASDGNIELVDIISDASLNVYAIGYVKDATTFTMGTDSYTIRGNWDAFICSFTRDGTYRWSRQIAGTGRDDIKAITLDQFDSLYIVGAFKDETIYFTPTDSLQNFNHYDSYIAKYDTDGNLSYVKRAFWGSNQQRLQDVETNVAKNEIAVVGTFKNELTYYNGVTDVTVPITGSKDLFIATFTYDSVFKDIVIYNTTNQSSTLKNIVTCNAGGYFVTGNLYGRINFNGTDFIEGDLVNSDALIIRVDDNLDFLWARLGRGSAYEHVNWATSDIYSNVYTTGKIETDGATFDSTATLSSAPLPAFGGSDMYVAKYNRSGILQWVQRYGDSGNDNSYGTAISENLFYMIGNYAGTLVFGQDTLRSGSTTNVDVAFGVMDVNGNPVAAESTSGTLEDIGTGLAVRSPGDVNITGHFASPSLTAGPIVLNNASSPNTDGFVLEYVFDFKVSWSKIQHITCNGGTDGELVITPYFGRGPYNYVWDHNAGLADSTATNLTAGLYQVTVTDADNKTAIGTYTITEPSPITISETIINVLCYGDNTGAISISISGGNGPYTQLWSGPGGYTSTLEDITGLFAGAYTITATDTKGCTAFANYNVTESPQIRFTGSDTTTIIRPPGSNGAINLNVSGGVPSYTFDWRDPGNTPISTNEDLSGLDLAGQYTVYVTDQSVCTSDTSFVVEDATAFISFIDSVKNVSCNGGSDGYISVSTSGGTGPYTYAWDKLGVAVGGNSPILSGVDAGNYCVTVTDNSDGRTSQSCVTITEPSAAIAAGLLLRKNVSCFGACDGSIEITVSGGTPPYSYNWTGPSFTSSDKDVFNLCPGFYNVTVTDANGCSDNISSIEITEPGILSVSIDVISEPLCAGELTGELKANPVGGAAPYSYQWNDPGSQVTQSAENLDGGTYSVVVTDFNGCTTSGMGTIDEPGPIMLAVTKQDPSCGGTADGFISLAVSGGTPSFSYLWTTIDGSLSDPPINKDQTNLTGGTYCVTITDANNCTFDTCITLLVPLAVMVDSVRFTNETCFGAGDGTITIYASGGAGSLEYSIDDGTSYLPNGGAFTGLNEGVYNIRVQDANICEAAYASNPVTLTSPAQITFTETSTGITCNGAGDGTITISNVAGGSGSGYEFSSDGGSIYSANGGLFTGLAAGNYDIMVRDSDACEQAGNTISLSDPVPFSVSSSNAFPTCQGADTGKISVSASGGTLPYKFVLMNEGLRADSNSTGSFAGLALGDYTVEADDANGCGPELTGTLTVDESSVCEFKVFTAFSPNEDFINDLWNIQGIQAYSNAIVKVYDSWGTLVFTSQPGYPDPWNGKENNNGNELPAGTYYYVIDLGDGSEYLSGTVNIIK